VHLSGAGLRCIRGGREVFSGQSFSVSGGETLVVAGPNGAGKSSLLRLIAGLVRIEAGSIDLTGGDAELSVPEQAHYLGHLDPLKGALTVAENLAVWARYLNSAGQAEPQLSIEAALASVGLGELAALPGGYLSAGQRRRLSLARLLVVRRPIWLLDEPTAPLDPQGEESTASLLRAHLEQGGMIVAATHSPLPVPAARHLHMGGGA
jgi:heme exporter protein A